MAHPHAVLLTRFYVAFARREAETMASCYHPEAHFQDEVFDLKGSEIGAMWRMLCERGDDLDVNASGVRADDVYGSARWVATYSFGPNKRPVRNEIEASFTFEDGLILSHRDRFSFWKWSRQAVGVPGLLLGWTPFLKSSVRKRAAGQLARYIETHPDVLGT